MDRETFLARNKTPKTTTVNLDGDEVKARKLTQAEVETIRRKYATEDKALEGFRYIVSRCVLRDDGGRMFTDADMAALADLDFDEIERVAIEVSRFSGLKVDAKNG